MLIPIAGHTFKEYSWPMFTVIETSIFIKYAKPIWADDERIEFINWIAINPLAGDVIPNSGGCWVFWPIVTSHSGLS
jgi:hypothetical protein